MSKALKYFEHILAYVSAALDFVSILAFASLIGVPVGLGSSAVGIKSFEITAGIKKYKLIIKKRKKARSYIYVQSKFWFLKF